MEEECRCCRLQFATSTCAWEPRTADHGWGLGYMLNKDSRAGPTLNIFGHGRDCQSLCLVDLEYINGYSYVMNWFDATKAHADPPSVTLSDEVHTALGQ